MKIKHILHLICILPIFSLSFNTTLQKNTPKSQFLYVEGEYLMLDGSPYIMKGINYYPRDYGWTSMMDWDWEAVDQELALAESLHANTVRTGISYLYGTENSRQTDNIFSTTQVTPAYLEAVDHFLEIADSHHLKVVFWLNDAMPWDLYNPQNFQSVENYLESVIPHYADDPRVAAWDLATDLDGSLLMPAPTGGYGSFAWMNRDTMITFLQLMSEKVKSLDPNHLVAVGFCWPSSSLLVQDFTDFLFFQFLGADHPEVLTNQGATGNPQDYIQGNHTNVSDLASLTVRIENKLISIHSQLKKPMPIVLSEFGTYTGAESSETIQSNLYLAVLDATFLRLKLAGALNWSLTDFSWPPKAYSTVPADDPALSSVYEHTFGIFNLDYSPKLSVEVVKDYFSDSPMLTLDSRPEEIRFVFSDSFIPGEGDQRILAAAFDRVSYLNTNNEVLQVLDIGDSSARPYLSSGFYPEEGPWDTQADNFAWAGGDPNRAVIRFTFPTDTSHLELRVLGGVENMSLEVGVDGEVIQTITLSGNWQTIRIDLPVKEQLNAGEPQKLLGKFNLPVSEGAAVLQSSQDGQSWQDVVSAQPQSGLAVFHFSALAGENQYRAVWEGNGIYQSVVSETLTLEVTTPTSTAITPSQTLPSSAALSLPVVTTQKIPIWLILSVGAVLLAGSVLFIILMLRRKSRPQ